MKRFYSLFLLAILCLVLASCGGGNDTAEDSSDNNVSGENLFHDNVYEDDNIKVEITKYEVILPGDTTYSEYNEKEYSDGPVIAFWYNATNKSDEEIDPIGAWLDAGFKAIQDNDPNKINELEVSSLPDDRFLESQSEIIKKGGTVECCTGYLLDDETTPVTLISENIVDDVEYGRQDYDITKKGDSSGSEQSNSSDSDESEVSADFKATMDSYEDFFDEYVEFMKKYKDNPTDAELMSEAADMLSKESDMLEKMESMDQESMTTAEAAYYLEVTSRIYKKLSEVM